MHCPNELQMPWLLQVISGVQSVIILIVVQEILRGTCAIRIVVVVRAAATVAIYASIMCGVADTVSECRRAYSKSITCYTSITS